MQSYLIDIHAKIFAKPKEKPFNVIKTIRHDRQ